jgi:hypothetical protein
MKRQTFVLFEGLAAECRAANPPVLRHHLRTLDHEAEGARELHAIEAVGSPRWNGFLCHAVI